MKREPKLQPCANKDCDKQFMQYKSTVKVCSMDCAIQDAKTKRVKQEAKEWRVEKKIRKDKLNDKAPKNYLQDEINKLSKMIDVTFGFVNCIDCDKKMGLVNAAHLHNVQGNENIRYNLHNLHSARAHCNKFSSEHKVGYRLGLESRYGLEYKKYVEFEMRLEYKHIGLKSNEVKDALRIVRKIIREYSTYKFKDGIEARNEFNKIIGIYTK